MSYGTGSAAASPEPAAASPHALLLVAGSGRSGTSLFAGLSHQLGMYIPQPEVVADSSNPKGFGEPRWTVDFHRQLLRTVQVAPEDARPVAWEITASTVNRPRARARLATWLDEQFSASDRVVVKDPRITWFVELYRDVGAGLGVEPRIVTMVRHPAASVRSRQLAYGQGSTDTKRLVGWLNMMLFLEQRTRQMPRALISYEDLLSDWRGTLGIAEDRLGTPLVRGATQEQLSRADALVDPSLRRAGSDWAGLDVPRELEELADATHATLRRLADGRDDETLHTLDDLSNRYAEYYATAETVARSSIVAATAAERRRLRHKMSSSPSASAGTSPTSSSARAWGRIRRSAGLLAGRLGPHRRSRG